MKTLLSLLAILSPGLSSFAQADYDQDVFPTSKGDLTITFIGHATLMFEWDGMKIYVDPVMREADFTKFPKADVIFLTHHHGDHTDAKALEALLKDDTYIIMTPIVAGNLSSMSFPGSAVLSNWETAEHRDINCEAIPAYNIEHKRPTGQAFHPKGEGNGYVLTFGDFKILIGGDTENIPEYEKLAGYQPDVAFLPMNLPYTMTPEMVASAAKMIRPKILYPYHYGNTETEELLKLMEDEPGIEVRIRRM
ncbi:MAG: MBL fold metallo-hydrolase [Bacteroidales bacterium]|nr:MBL fold metallo-hydrolase [Bacteroidales bacterium]